MLCRFFLILSIKAISLNSSHYAGKIIRNDAVLPRQSQKPNEIENNDGFIIFPNPVNGRLLYVGTIHQMYYMKYVIA